jgi:hypothetical protein
VRCDFYGQYNSTTGGQDDKTGATLFGAGPVAGGAPAGPDAPGAFSSDSDPAPFVVAPRSAK